MQGPGDDRRGRNRDYDERAGRSVLLVSELNTEVMIVCLCFCVFLIEIFQCQKIMHKGLFSKTILLKVDDRNNIDASTQLPECIAGIKYNIAEKLLQEE
jgi:hypothetical protein